MVTRRIKRNPHFKAANRARQLNKAVSPAFAATANSSMGRLTDAPQARPFALLDAINAATNQGLPWAGQFEPLPRNPVDDGLPFGPLSSLVPDPINTINAQGHVDPRAWEYPVGWNLPGSDQREVPWEVLRASAAGVGVIRRCIEVRKKNIRDLDWNFAPTEQAIQDAYNKDRSKGRIDVEAELRERYEPDVKRLREYWRKPWKSQGWNFAQWCNAVLEDRIVLDAVSIYPQRNGRGDTTGLKVIDPTTIKLLLNQYGERPAPPFPAFQQEIYGFPRGEWTATVYEDAEGNEILANGYSADSLFYYAENTRSSSPYGLSPVEMALFDARLWLQRQKWMLAEYDDGSTPLTFIETSPSEDGSQLSLTQKRQWERAFNAEYSGNTAQRLRIKVMPNGWKAQQLAGIDERYRPEYDLFLIKLLCSFMSVPITELGFTETQGLGGSSMHEHQADVSGRLGKQPDTAMLSDVINCTSTDFLGMPPEIEFSFASKAAQNDLESAQIEQIRIGTASKSVNEVRAAAGESLLPFAEANMHFIVGGPQGIIFLEGAKERIEAAEKQAQMAAEAQALGTAGKMELENKRIDDGASARQEARDFQREEREANQDFQRETAKTEIKKSAAPEDWMFGPSLEMFRELQEQRDEWDAFRNWRRKQSGKPRRPFLFKACTPDWLMDEPSWYSPDWAEFEGHEWVSFEDELNKMTWLEWNAKNPLHPKGPNGRFVKAGSTLLDALKEESKRPVRPRAVKPKAKGSGDALDASSTMGGMDKDFMPHHESQSGILDDIRAGRPDPLKRGEDDNMGVFVDPIPEYSGKGTAYRVMQRSADGTQVRRLSLLSTKAEAERWAEMTIRTKRRERAQREAAEVVEPKLKPTQRAGEREVAGTFMHPDDDAAFLDMASRAEAGGFAVPAGWDHESRTLWMERGLLGWSGTSSRRQLMLSERGYEVAQELRAAPKKEPELSPSRQRRLEPEFAAMRSEVVRQHGGTLDLSDEAIKESLSQRGIDFSGLNRAERIDAVTEAWLLEKRTDALMEQARQGIAGAKLAKLGPTQRNLLSQIGQGKSFLPGFKGTKGLGNLVESGEDRGILRLTDLGRAAFAQLHGLNKAAAPEPKDGGADPKAQEPVAEQAPPVDSAWPGWLMDLAIAAAVAPLLMAAMRGLSTSALWISALRSLFRRPDLLDAAPAQGTLQRIARQDHFISTARNALRTEPGLLDEVVSAIEGPIRQAHIEGAWTGERAADAMLDWVTEGNDARAAVELDVDWGNWSPGHPEAAQLLLEEGGLERLLGESDVTIRRIAANRLDELGRIIGQGLAKGESPAAIGRAVADVFGDESWAHMTALTETNRAQSWAAGEQYKKAGMRFKGWMTALDQRVCKICGHNERHPDGRPRIVPINEPFPSGDMWPPGHPRCRCGPIPVIELPGGVFL